MSPKRWTAMMKTTPMGTKRGPCVSSALTKALIRSTMIQKLKTQEEGERTRKSNLIKNRLFRTRVFQKAKNIMCYIAFGGEVETRQMIRDARTQGKRVAVPLSKTQRSIRPCVLEGDMRLVRGPHGTQEPAQGRLLTFKDLDLVIVPGVAFDLKGNRIGRGWGCYDYFLKKIPKDTPTIGLAFDFQILPALPAKAHDVSVDRILSA